ncbi:MAG TPA: galactose-1-phosphate uridylyltransferase [Methylomirabilota bacterium]|jgi:UDPglucose--hexose-1-phosphate uridylyltransferase|nr:galactose-1-phosphate uridylyltransferase [Methylomirabilota bacterium]
MKGELRKDPSTGKWSLVRRGEARPWEDNGALCPFCPGNESLTPKEIVAYRPPGSAPNGTGWQVRVFPEGDPYFNIEEDLVREGVGMFDRISTRGASEIVVEDPGHELTLASMDEAQVERVLWMYRDRIQDLKRDSKIRNVVVTRFQGKPGAKIRHPYSRILATPIIFDDVRTELNQAREYYAYKRRCVYCDTVREELASGERLVRMTSHFVVFVPYAARVAFELRILPRRHACAYEDISGEQVSDLARLLRGLLRILGKALGDPPFEMVLHTAPNLQVKVLQGEWDTVARDYHWHFEVLPGTEHRRAVAGIAVNETFPEEAARALREDSATRPAGSPSPRSPSG